MVEEKVRNYRSQKETLVQNREPESLAELFNEEGDGEVDEKEEMVRSAFRRQLDQQLSHAAESHKMSMKERQSAVIATKAATMFFGTWATIGVAMLARSCINFDKGPKFKV
jgi:hypothetical protein